MARVFKGRIIAQFNGASNLKGAADFFRNKLNCTHTNIGAKVQPHQPSILSVYPTQMLKYLRFNQDCGVCGNNKENTSSQHKWVNSRIKFLQKGHYYLSLLTVAHCFFFMRGDYM